MTKIFTKDNLPGNPDEWAQYIKVGTTHISELIDEPFQIVYDEGTPEETRTPVCQRGRIAYDLRGIPFPIPEEAFEMVYTLQPDRRKIDTTRAQVENLPTETTYNSQQEKNMAITRDKRHKELLDKYKHMIEDWWKGK